MNQHIFKAGVLGAGELQVCFWGECYNDQYSSFDLMYGRKFFNHRVVAIDVFAGVSYFNFKTRNPEPRESGYETKNTIGFPIQGRIRFLDGKAFNLGLQLHANINTASSIISAGPFFQWTFKPVKKEV